MSKSKPIVTTAIAAGLVVSAASSDALAAQDKDLLFPQWQSTADDALLALDENDWLEPLFPADPTETEEEFIEIDTAQTCCGNPSADTVTPGGNDRSDGNGIKKPGKGITLDNGIKKPGKLRTQGDVGNQRKLKKKKKRN
ncbi:MAG: hypothetical protein AAF557_14860 [Pseudomonadota bacterium]